MKTVWLHGKKQKAVTYSLKADEPTVFFCQLDGGAWHRCVATAQPRTSVSFDLKLRRGTHKLRVYGVDRFGNRGATIRASRFVKR